MNNDQVSHKEWQQRAEMLRAKLAECQQYLAKSVDEGKIHVVRAEDAEDALVNAKRGSVLVGLDLVLEHLETQKVVWGGTDTPPEVVLDILRKNIEALKTLVIQGKLPEKNEN